MPPASSPGSHGQPTEHTSQHPSRPDDRARRTPDRAAKVRFRRAITLMVMTIFLPGSAQLVAGNRRVGRIALRTSFVLLAVGTFTLLLSLVWHGFAFRIGASPFALGVVKTVLMLVAVGWALLLIDAWRLGEPLSLVKNQRLTVVGINGLLCFTVAGTLLFSAHQVGVY